MVTISNCLVTGNTTGSWDSSGGYFGAIRENINVNVTIANSTNNRNVTGRTQRIGGFVGRIVDNVNLNMELSNCTNNGTVAGYFYAGSFVGLIRSSTASHSLNLTAINCANKAMVSASSGMACGFFCVDPSNRMNVNTDIFNSINKGSVSASTYAYGMTNLITSARNVVSMGSVASKQGSHTFWNESAKTDLFYGMEGMRVNCTSNTKYFKYNDFTWFFDVVSLDEHVNDLLNDEAIKQNYGMMWTRELELVDQVLWLSVDISGEFEKTFQVELGTPLAGVGNLSFYFKQEQFGIVKAKSETRVVFEPAHVVTRNMTIQIIRKYHVVLGPPYSGGVFVFPGDTLSQLAEQTQLKLDQFIVVERDTWDVLSMSYTLKDEDSLALCHSVTVRGAFSDSLIVESETQLGQIQSLSPFFSDGRYSVMDIDSQPVVVYDATFPVTMNMSIFVVKKLVVTVGSPYNITVYVSPGESLQQVQERSHFSIDGFVALNRSTKAILFNDSLVMGDMDVALCHNVTLHHASETVFFYVEHQQALGTNTDLANRASGHHLVLTSDHKTELMLSHEVSGDLDVMLYSRVTATGLINATFLVVSGQQRLGETVLKEYLEPSNFYEVKGAGTPSRQFSSRDTIDSDITVVVTDKCDTFDKQKCQDTNDVCHWNKGSCSREVVESSNIGLIVGICVGVCLLVIVIVIVVAVVVVKRQRRMILKDTELN